MPASLVGRPISDLETPCLLLDLDAMHRNIHRMASTIQGAGKAWRPHAKAFKTPAIAWLLRKAGAIGVTAAKVSEAEVMAASGIDDILIAHLVVGSSRCARLAALQHIAQVKATVDHPIQIPPLADAAQAAGVEIGLLVDLDLGMGRTGVSSPEAAIALGRLVHQTPGLRLDGLMGYEGHTLMIQDPLQKREAIEKAIERLARTARQFESDGLPCRIVSAGGTGSYQFTSGLVGPTELQAGGGIFACNYYRHACQVKDHEPALFVLGAIVSRPAPDRLILDFGKKAISDHAASPSLPAYPDAIVKSLSAEHATVLFPADSDQDSPDTNLDIGAKILAIPGYSDLTFVLHDRVTACKEGLVVAEWPLLGRGKLE